MSELCRWDDCMLPLLPSRSRVYSVSLMSSKRTTAIFAFRIMVRWQLDSGKGWVKREYFGMRVYWQLKKTFTHAVNKGYAKDLISQIRDTVCLFLLKARTWWGAVPDSIVNEGNSFYSDKLHAAVSTIHLLWLNVIYQQPLNAPDITVRDSSIQTER